ncbi:Hypothetical predicted protein [Lecanosticta acicola]|uniref:Extracellular membrane protein CFEM domain-containing protein n=1 Tax=Lecanosticta acicola TaxID=111012 RepID=A0AAI9EDZ6_9PEZI|nr:Hypothetical predicted protein [Lecanosticta acicola]
MEQSVRALGQRANGLQTRCVLGNVQFSGCAPTNTTCLCTSAEYADAVRGCLKECTIRETLAALRFQKTTCKAPIRDQGGRTRNVAWALYCVACITVFGRFLFRSTAFLGSGLGPDDLMVGLGLLLVTPLNITMDIMTHHGLGRDVWMVDPDDVTFILRAFWSGEFCYILALAATKMAVVFAMAGTNIGLDILVYILPITALMRIKTMSLRKRIGVGLMFSFGLFVTICSIIRLQYLIAWGRTTNPTWHNNFPALWSMVELNLSVVCACLPSMAGLAQRVYKVATGGSWGPYPTGNSSSSWRTRSGRNRDSGVQLRDIPSPSAVPDEGSDFGNYRVISVKDRVHPKAFEGEITRSEATFS